MRVILQCEFCDYTNQHHIAVLNHEKGCVFNPLNGYCHTCGEFVHKAGVDMCADGFDETLYAVRGKCPYHHPKEHLKNHMLYAVEIKKTNPNKKKEVKAGQLTLVFNNE